MNKLSTVFQVASAALGTIPGLTVLVTNLGTPPAYKWLFGVTVEVVGCFVLLVLWLNREKLQRAEKRPLLAWAIGCLAAFVVLLVGYIFLQDRTLVVATKPHYKSFGPVYFPLRLSGDLAERVEQEGSREAVVDKYGPGAIDAAINKTPGLSSARTWTTVVFLADYVGLFTLLTLAFGLLGWRLASAPDGGNPPPGGPAPPGPGAGAGQS
jgi:hypothetical protein